ncbi:MAG TPA: ABC transporter permease [Pyrinomonadaceae bacterium]|nr:ABC transporter permease [Pyrinomonadaceae bacterium]
MNTLWQDLRYGFRMLWKSPAFTLVAVLALALGIGANTAIFSVVNTVLLRPLPFERPEQLVLLWETHPFGRQLGYEHLPGATANFNDWRQQTDLFEGMAALDGWNVVMTGGAEPQRLTGVKASANLFSLLRVQPMLGRGFLPEDERTGASRVVVISHGLWQRRFGSDPAVVGKTLALDGESYNVVGIMPASVTFPQDMGLPAFFDFSVKTDLWTPYALSDEETRNRGSHHIAVVGRMKEGVRLEQAQAQLTNLARRLEEQYPDDNKDWGAVVLPLHEQVVGKSRRAILILLGAVGFVLLIACANVANLLLARATARRKEIAIRSALGATRGRVVRQLLTESVLLSLGGGAFGAWLAMWGVDLLVALSPGNLPRPAEIGIDGRVLAYTFLVSLATGVLFGLIPALQISRPDFNESLKEGGRGASGSPRRQRARSLLVVSEVALALVLLISAGLLLKSFISLQNVKPGFAPEGILTAEIGLPEQKYTDDKRIADFYRQVIARVQQLPGVEAVGAVSQLPLSGAEEVDGFNIEGRTEAQTVELTQSADFRVVAPDYFRAMGIPLMRGRQFDDRDRADAPGVMIIDEAFARRFFPGEDPIGKRIDEQGSRTRKSFMTVVGVVGSVKHASLSADARPTMYLSYEQSGWLDMTLTVRASGDASNLAAAVRREVSAVDKDQPVTKISTMEETFARAVAPQRFNMMLLGIFAAVAMILATVGIYGVIAYTVSQRSREMGIRIALGATRRDILKLVVGQAMLMACVGVGLGLLGALALTRLMAGLLYGVSATDPLIFISISLLLAVVALLASYIPARRAMKVDPIVALHYE